MSGGGGATYTVPPGVSQVMVTAVGVGGSGGGQETQAHKPDAFNSWRLLRILRSRLRHRDLWPLVEDDLRAAINDVLDGNPAEPATKEIL